MNLDCHYLGLSLYQHPCPSDHTALPLEPCQRWHQRSLTFASSPLRLLWKLKWPPWLLDCWLSRRACGSSCPTCLVLGRSPQFPSSGCTCLRLNPLTNFLSASKFILLNPSGFGPEFVTPAQISWPCLALSARKSTVMNGGFQLFPGALNGHSCPLLL